MFKNRNIAALIINNRYNFDDKYEYTKLEWNFKIIVNTAVKTILIVTGERPYSGAVMYVGRLCTLIYYLYWLIKLLLNINIIIFGNVPSLANTKIKCKIVE